jgi:hypothetical protein
MGEIKHVTALTLDEYRAAQRELQKAADRLSEGFNGAIQRGDHVGAAEWSDQLEITIKGFEECRLRLSPRDRFIATYNVSKAGKCGVSLVVPADVPPIKVLSEAEQIARNHQGLHAINQGMLKLWILGGAHGDCFGRSRKIAIDPGVDEPFRDLAGTTSHFASAKLELPTQLDLALCHVAFSVLVGKDLFRGEPVRYAGGVLIRYSSGLVDADQTFSAEASLPATRYIK